MAAMAIENVNPATGDAIESYNEVSVEDLEVRLKRAAKAFVVWRREPLARRTELLGNAASALEANQDRFAELMATEMGKPLREGRAEIEKCAWVCRYYAEQAAGLLAPQPVETDATTSFIAFEPLGPLLAIMPWNFPFWQVFRFVAPHLTAGNVGLLKHASNVPGCALAIEDVLRQAGYPEGVFQTLLLSSQRVAGLIEDPRVKAITLTGSTLAGRAVAKKAGECLKKTVLELGGSDPCVVLSDADLDVAVASCVTSRMINGGQSCIAAKRFIVTRENLEAFEQRVVDAMRGQRMGDPLDETTDLGPMARADLRDELHEQVMASIAGGARCLCGGEKPKGRGAFYPPTVLTGVKPGMPAYGDELFGPVAAILPADNDEDAVRLANDTVFGLGAAVFSQDVAAATRIAVQELEAGSCFVNTLVRSDPRLPFGGINESGYGRELGSFGFYEFVNVKTVYVG